MNALGWFAIVGCLLTLNSTYCLLRVSKPPSIRFSFLSPPFQQPTVQHSLCNSGSLPTRVGSVHSQTVSGVSTASDEKQGKAASSTDIRFLQLKKWLAVNGADLDVDGLAIRSHAESAYEPVTGVKGERYLTALRHYPRDAVIASVPSHLHFTTEALEELLTSLIGARHTSSDAVSSAKETALWKEEEEPDASETESTLFYFGQMKKDAKIRLSFMLAAFQELGEAEVITSPLNSSISSSHFSVLIQGWLAYLRLLPLPLPSIPLFWKAEELQALNHPICHAVFARLRCLYTAFRSHGHLLRAPLSALGQKGGAPEGAPEEAREGASGASLDEETQLFQRLVAAHATVSSRCLNFSKDSCAFVPLVDLCAHAMDSPNAKLQFKADSGRRCSCKQTAADGKLKQEKTNSIYKEEAAESPRTCAACRGAGVSVQLVALRDIAPGEPIQISFGDKLDNPTLLLNYGLLPKDNP